LNTPSATLRILFLTATPVDLPRLAVDEEYREVDRHIQGSRCRDRCELRYASAVRGGELAQALQRHEPHVVHFSGHGSREGELLLPDATGRSKPASPARVAELFGILNARDLSIRCVVLNACYSEPLALALTEHVDCVIGTAAALKDKVAITFAGAFYEALGFGRDVEAAYLLARNRVALEVPAGVEPPRLHCRAGVDPATVRLLPVARERTTEPDERAALTPSLAVSSPPEESAHELRLTTVALLRDVSDAVFVEAVARELKGRVVRLAGGSMRVLFGLDRWLADEPKRALRLALVTAHATGAVGIATGRTLRGAQEVTGEAIDTAAQLAARGGVTLDAVTAAAVRGEAALAFAPDGTARLEARAERRGTAQDEAIDQTPFVGREVELATLLRSAVDAWEQVRPTGVAMLGPAGIGKSRLRRVAMQRLRERLPDATCVLLRCDLFRRDAPFGALREAVAQTFDPSAAGLFEPVTGLDPRRDPVAALDRVRSSLGTLLFGAAERGPVVLIVEDAQWLDAASLTTLKWLRENHETLPMAVWAFGRPDAAGLPALVGGAASELGPLDAEAAARLLRSLVGAAPEAALQRAGGHPLFLEELGRVLTLHGGGEVLDTLALPPSIESAWLAQFDRMSASEREFLKLAAVFGRTFWVEGAAALGAEAEVATHLHRGGLIVPRPKSRLAGAREFRFRASALQEVAHQLLTDGLRARLHGRAAAWLSTREGATPDEQARHWELAGDDTRAAEQYVRAAESAAAVAETATTCAHVARALALTQDLPLRWRALVARDGALQLSDQVELWRQGLTEIDALAREMGLREQVEAAWRRCFFARTRAGRDEALEVGGRAFDLSERLGDPWWGATVSIDLAMILTHAGSFADARTCAEAAREMAAQVGDGWLKARADATLAYVLGESGDAARAMEFSRQAADGFATAGDRRREAILRANAGWAMLLLGRITEAEVQIPAAIEAAQRVGNQVTVATCTHNLGVLRRITGDLPRAAALHAQAEVISAKLRHAKLTCTAAIEGVYLALQRGDDPGGLIALAAGVVRQVESARSAPLAASARAVALRAEARAEGVSHAGVESARALLPAQQEPERRAELCVAIWEAGGRLDVDRDAALRAIEAVCAGSGAAPERDARRDVFGRRFLVPRELFAG
jgi:tetratricopeptide (TPR) repeat protein